MRAAALLVALGVTGCVRLLRVTDDPPDGAADVGAELVDERPNSVDASSNIDDVPVAPSDIGDVSSDITAERDGGATGDLGPPRDDGRPDAEAPTTVRLVAPMSGATVAHERVTLRWRQGDARAWRLELCADRRCARVVAEVPGTLERGEVRHTLDLGALARDLTARGMALPPVLFWRVDVGATSAVWWFRRGGPGAAASISWGATPDLDADGFADLLVGAPGAERAFVYRGAPTGLVADPIALAPALAAAARSYGRSVASAGDLNGDGYGDLVVGGSGYAHVYYGGATVPAGAPTVFNRGMEPGFGATVSAAGDLNGDGYGDLCVGGTRQLSLLFGSPSGATTAGAMALPFNNAAATPLAVAGPGDLDADGNPDLVAGFAVEGAPPVAVVLYGDGSGAPSVYLPVTLGSRVATAPVSVAVSGDLDGDGLGDAVAAVDGTVYAILGRRRPATPVAVLVDDALPATRTAFSVATAGDLDDNGLPDIAWGIPGGFAYALPAMGRIGRGTAQRQSGETSAFGDVVAGAGDLDGDGRVDLAVANPTDGRIRIYRSAGGVFRGDAVTAPTLPAGARFGASLTR